MILGHPQMEVDLVMILHLVRKSASSVTQDTRLQEEETEPVPPQVHGQELNHPVQVHCCFCFGFAGSWKPIKQTFR